MTKWFLLGALVGLILIVFERETGAGTVSNPLSFLTSPATGASASGCCGGNGTASIATAAGAAAPPGGVNTGGAGMPSAPIAKPVGTPIIRFNGGAPGGASPNQNIGPVGTYTPPVLPAYSTGPVMVTSSRQLGNAA